MMEVLRSLEGVHRTLALMDSHSLSCKDDSSSHLFFAKFFLFLAQVSKDIKQMEENLQLLVEHLPKVSEEFLQDLAAQQIGCDQDSALAGGPQMAYRTSFFSGKNSSKKMVEVKCAANEAHERKKSRRNSIALLASPELCVPKEQVLKVNETSSMLKDVKRGEIQCVCDERTPAIEATHVPHSSLAPYVKLKAMERAQSTLEDFCRSYFMFHGLDEHNPKDIFKYLPVLMFVEAYIYQLDEENEKLLNPSTGKLCASISDAERVEHAVLTQRKESFYKVQSAKHEFEASTETAFLCNSVNPFEGLCAELANRGLMTQRIALELKAGVEYWLLEQSLCRALSDGSEILIGDVMRAVELKSFDYRVLNLLLYQLLGTQVNEVHLTFLRVSELLVEISDDLFDYEEDVLRNNFNILRMFARIYGPAKAPNMLLEPSLASHYQMRCKEATMEGGSKSKNAFGSWTLPPLIVDEATYRSSVQ
ncbi:hypothetical protein O6H91_07G109100 [Diphasiastrum complanatum]|uniref:Uncharacterized protein n=1 Tax=Diphasiastrum complanatum TaxID=34168 RepID=A0ACC2D8Q6_DIPCM|nr:hypothetical protein O6H91_07G109100 [Diphasiastrum complanatum]